MASTGRTVLKLVGGLLVALIVAAVAGYLWAKSATAARLAKTYETHRVDFPIPFPLSESELEALRAERRAAAPPAPVPAPAGDPAAPAPAADPAVAPEPPPDPLAGVDLAALALERALARGKHLMDARYACFECHGHDLAGGTMINDPAVGTAFGPNLTGGEGSRVASFTAADWDRSVRHGVRPDGKPAIMPSIDFVAMSDRELSDIVAYIRSRPKVDKTMAPITLGPLLNVLAAVGQVVISAEVHADHAAPHAVEPPLSSDTLAFGKHLAQTCAGCHNAELTGGPIAGAPPDWAAAANLTPHAEGLAGWTYEQFQSAVVEGKKRDGSPVLLPMSLVPPLGKNMKPEELAAMWAYLQSLPPKPDPK